MRGLNITAKNKNLKDPLDFEPINKIGTVNGLEDLMEITKKSPLSTTSGFESSNAHFIDVDEYNPYINKGEKGATPFPFSANIDKSRAYNQSAGEQLGRTAIKMLPKIGLEFISQIGNIIDVEDYFNAGSNGEVGNWLNTWAQEQKQNIDASKPVFRENPDKPLDVGDFAWWMQNGSSLVESATAFVGLGYLTGGGILKALTNGGKALEWLQLIGKGASQTQNALKGIKVASGLANTLVLNQAEAVGIGTATYQTVYGDTVRQLKSEGKLSDKEIKSKANQYASDQAASAINFNRLNLFLNVTSSFAFLKTPLLTRQLRKATSLTRSLKHATIEGFQEAGEETINMIAQKQAEDKNYTFEKGIKDAFSAQGMESALLGFVGGFGQTGLTNTGRSLKIYKDSDGKRYSRNNQQNTLAKEQEIENERIKNLDVKKDTEAFNDTLENLKLYQEISKANEDGDKEKVEKLQSILLHQQAYKSFENGTTQSLIDLYSGIKTITKEEASNKDLNPDTYIKQADKAIKLIETLEQEYIKTKPYLNSKSIYDAKAQNIFNKKDKEELINLLDKQKEEIIKDTESLGIETSDLTFNEDGTLKFEKYKFYPKETKDALNSLTSLKKYKETKETLDILNTNIKSTTEISSFLSSDKHQKKLRNEIKERKKEEKRLRAKAKLNKKNNKNNKDNKNTVNNIKNVDTDNDTDNNTDNQNNIEDATDTDNNTSDTNNEGTVGPTFALHKSLKEFEQGANDLVKKDIPLQNKINAFKNKVNELKKVEQTSEIQGAILQFNRAAEYYEKELQIQEDNAIQKEEALQKAKDLLDNMDLAPLMEDTKEDSNKDDSLKLSKEDEKLLKQKKILEKVLDIMEKADLDITSFSSVATFIQQSLGKVKFISSFDTFKALYNLIGRGENTSLSYEEIFYDVDTRKSIIDSNKILETASAFNDIYNLSEIEFDNEANDTLKDIIEENGYLINSKENVINNGLKILEADNKIAWLARNYKSKVKVSRIKFNNFDFVVSKEDIDNELNANASELLLDYNEINVGSKITLKAVTDPNGVVHADGSISYPNGDLEVNGEITKRNPEEFAPIAIYYKGEQVKGAYLHVVEWINGNNIADFKDVKRQKAKLLKIRKAVLKSETGIETKIKKRGTGQFIRDFKGKKNKVSKNLPNVEIGIASDGALFTSNTKKQKVTNRTVSNGLVYAIMQVDKNKKQAIPILPDTIGEHSEYVTAVTEAIRLYLNADPNASRVIKLQEETGINLTNIEGLREYLSFFLHLSPALDGASFSYNDFAHYVENTLDENKSVVRIITNKDGKGNIEFGIGSLGNTIGFINREIINKQGEERRNIINIQISKLTKVLNNYTRINISKNLLNTKVKFPLITFNDVTFNNINYNDFVKEHTSTDLYSHTLSNGKEIYTIQSNIAFDETFAFQPTVVEETKETPKKDISEIEVEYEKELGFNPYEDLGDDIEDLDLAPNTQNIKSDLIAERETQFQRYQENDNKGKSDEIIVSEKVLRNLAEKLSSRIGIETVFITDRTKKYKGKIENGIAYINLAYATLDTPVHEILAHPIIRVIKNKSLNSKDSRSLLYENLLEELSTSEIGQKVLNKIKEKYKTKKSKLTNIANNNEVSKEISYSLEEQQEEAIVELLGLYTAKKLNSNKDKSLIAKLKDLFGRISDTIKALLTTKEVDITKIPDNATLNDLADLFAYSNSKLILPGYEVEYSTPDNNKFKIYQEASNHVSNLIKKIEKIDLSNISIKDISKTFDINDVPNNFTVTFPYGNFTVKRENDEWTLYHFNSLKEVNKLRNSEVLNFYNSTKPIVDFIERNKEFEQVKELIINWKKINDINYNPEEVYSRGQGFYSVIGAYSDIDINLMLQNLLIHIEDNEKAGGFFSVSAFTKNTNKRLKHIEGEGGKIRIKIFPKSNDILWASNIDVYSGSVWNAASKVNKNIKSELLGVSYSKYPSSYAINSIQPNLSNIIDRINHSHNELAINLNNNFRIEYDDDIPYSTKKIIDSTNSILDEKFGKLESPYKKVTIKDFDISLDNSNNGTFNLKNKDYYYSINKSIFGIKYKKIGKETKIVKKEEVLNDILNSFKDNKNPIDNAQRIKIKTPLVQPTKTNSNLNIQISTLKKEQINQKKESYNINTLGLRVFQEHNEDGTSTDYYQIYNFGNSTILDDLIPKDNKFISEKDANKEVVKIVLEAKNILAKEQAKRPVNTEQALINTKIAVLKKAAKKYQRSLIRSEVRPIHPEQPLKMDAYQKVDLAPKTLTKEQQLEYKETIPDSLFIQGVPSTIQNIVINHIIAKILKSKYISKNATTPLKEIETFKNELKNVRLNAYKDAIKNAPTFTLRKSAENNLKITENLIAQFEKIENIIYDDLRTYNGLIKKDAELISLNKKEANDNFILNEEGELVENNKWENEAIFADDGKKSISQEVANYFSYIEDIKEFKNINNKIIPVPKTIWGLNETIPFDEVINELSAILAYSNYQDETKASKLPNINSMLKTIDEWTEVKPYLYNVKKAIENAPDNIKNQLVKVMSKSYTHHVYQFQKGNGEIFTTNSDNFNIVSILQKEWSANINSSVLVDLKKGKLVLNTKKVTDIIANANKLVKNIKASKNTDEAKNNNINEAKEVLDSMGFIFPRKLVKTLYEEGVYISNMTKKVNLINLFTDKRGTFNIFLNSLKSLKGKDIEETSIFSNNTMLDKFTKQIAKLHPVYFTNSFKDVRGRTYYGYSLNKFITDRTQALKENHNYILEKLAEQPFSATSNWVKKFLTDAKFREHFGYWTYDGYREEGKRGRKLSTMSPAEIERTKINMFFSQNKTSSNSGYIVNLFYPTTSDKSVAYGLRTLGTDFKKKMIKGRITSSEMDWLYDAIITPEISRILALQENPDRYNISNYKEGGLMFNFIPSLNDSSVIKDLWVVEGDERELNKKVLSDAQLRLDIKNHLRSFLNKLINSKINMWEDFGFVKKELFDTFEGENYNKVTHNKDVLSFTNKSDAETANKHSVRAEATNYVLNYLVANVNIMQTFTTDPAFYWKSKHYKEVINRIKEDNTFRKEPIEVPSNRKEALKYYTQEDWIIEHEDLFNNMGKRLGADSAPGTDIANSDNNAFSLGVIADNTKEAFLIDYYKGLLKNKATDYINVNNTDAQEFTLLSEHLHLMVMDGVISATQGENLLYKDDNELEFTDEEKKIVYNVMKPVYVNNIWKDGIEHRVYVKSSAFPLSKSLTKGLEIDKLRINMEENSIDRVVFSSAIKIGSTKNPPNIFENLNKDKSNHNKIKDNFTIDIISHSMPRQGMKIQQEMPFSETKDFINDGTQQRKLLTASIRDLVSFKINSKSKGLVSGQHIQDLLDKKYNEAFKINYDNLVKELDFNIEEGTLNIRKLQKILYDEALKRKYPLYDLESLKLNEKEEFVVPLWLTGVSGKIEAMLNSIVDNRVRKLKPKGKSYILATSAGFKPIEGIEGENKRKETKGIIYLPEWENRKDKQLLPMRIEDINGVLAGSEGFDEATASVKPAEILIPFNFKDNDGKPLNLDDFTIDNKIDITKLSPKLLELFGFRIPTQGLNSMTYVKIVGFVPKTSGDLFIAPADFTVQMGSDFDIDKIYTNSYNTSFNNEVLTKYSGRDRTKQLQDDILDLHFSILSSTDKKVQSKIMTPLDLGDLKNIITQIYPYIKKNENHKEGIGISEEYNTRKYLNARAGKSGIGVFSADGTFLAIAQNKDLYIKTIGRSSEFVFRIGNHTSNRLSEPNTNTKSDKTKFDVNAAIQSLAVDNENEQGLHKLNINKNTFDAIRMLVASGFEEDVIFYFLNQPIIRRYSNLLTKAKDSATKYKIKDIIKDINKEFPIELGEENQGEHFREKDKKELLNMILEPSSKHNNTQISILKLFKELSVYGKAIQTVQSTVNTDSAGLGKNLFYSVEKEKQIKKLPINSIIKNADNLIGDYLSLKENQGEKFVDNKKLKDFDALRKRWFNGDLNETEKQEVLNELQKEGFIPVTFVKKGGEILSTINFIKPTTINGFASVYGLLLNNSIWSQERFFPYNNNRVLSVIEDLTDNIYKGFDKSITEKADLNKKIFTDIKSFLAVKDVSVYTDGELETERKRLLIDTKTNMSLGTILHSLKQKGKLVNYFTNRISIDIYKEVKPTDITYEASKAENINERPIFTAISKMLLNDRTKLGEFNGITYTPRKLMQDLITHQLITGGVQKAKQFIKYIPINYLNAIGYYKSITDLNLSNEKDFNTEKFFKQHIQHNPKEVLLRDTEVLNEYFNYNNGTIYIKKEAKTKSLPDFFSLRNKKALSGFDLYSYDKVAKHWRQISTLGSKNLMEYNPNTNIAESIIVSNNVLKSISTDLPTNTKDIKNLLNPNKGNNNTDNQILSNPKAQSIADFYNLNSDKSSTNKINFVLNKIITTSDNKYNSYLAQILNDNLNKIQNYRFIVDTNLQAQGSHSINDKTIRINPLNIKSKETFEKVILEEIIHAFTKKALIENTTGEVARLNSFRQLTKGLVQEALGKDIDEWIDRVNKKLKKGETLTVEEADIIYPLINNTEFVGRLFKSKKLQELLNNIQLENGETGLDKFFNLLIDLLAAIGIDIKKGSALEYATKDILFLIKQQPPSDSIKGEMKNKRKTIRTVDFINDRLGIVKEDGTLQEFKGDEADKVVKFIKNETTNLTARRVGNTVKVDDNIENGGQLDLFEENISPIIKKVPYSTLVNKEVYTKDGINTMRKRGNKHFGNPFTGTGSIFIKNPSLIKVLNNEEASQAYKDWLLNTRAEPDIAKVNNFDIQRKWILSQIKEGKLNNQTLLYMNDRTGYKSHADSLVEVVNEINNNIKDLAPNTEPDTEQGKSVPLLLAINNRLKNLDANIEKAEKREDFQKGEELKDLKQALKNRRDGVDALGNKVDISVMESETIRGLFNKGHQDMDEIEDMLKNKVTLEDALYIRKVIHFWQKSKDLLFTTDDEKSSETLLNKYNEVATKANIHETALIIIETKYMEDLIKKYGNNMSIQSIFAHFKDINGMQSDFLDISRSGNVFLDSIFLNVKDANVDALDESREIVLEIKRLKEKILPVLKNIGNKELYDIFRQYTKNGKLTGDIVSRYTKEFNKELGFYISKLKKNNIFNNYVNLLSYLKNNTKEINLNYIFPVDTLTDEQQIKADIHRQELKDSLGEKEYNEYMIKQGDLIDKYNKRKEGKVNQLSKKYEIEKEDLDKNKQAVLDFNIWQATNSPYALSNNLIASKMRGGLINLINFNSHEFMTFIPKDKSNYDANFKSIENNASLLEFYNFYKKTDNLLKSYMSKEDRIDLLFEGIPFITKTLHKEYKDKGMKIGLVPIMNAMNKSVRSTEISNTNSYIDPQTKLHEKNLSARLSKNNSEEYYNYISTKTIEYTLKEGHEPSKIEKDIWREDIIDKLAQKKSYDLAKILEVYALTVLAYKHKAKIEDNIKLAQNILQKQREFRRNADGTIAKNNSRIDLLNEEHSFLNTKAQFNYFVQVFYGKTKKEEGIGTKIYYNSEEKALKINYENILNNLDKQFNESKIERSYYEDTKKIIQTKISELGGVSVLSKKGDAILKYVQLKGMGWNIMSSIANLGFGYISNKIEAAGGRLYTSKQLSDAHTLVRHSILKNWSFNGIETDIAKKIRNMMEKWNVLNTAVHELYTSPMDIELGKNAKWLSPYNLTERTEYLNQAPLMIALAMNTIVNTDKGKISVWEALDENGNWNSKYGKEPKQKIKTLRHTIDQIIKKNHGNYDGQSPIKVKNEFRGRAISQFRTWIFEQVADRFEGEKNDTLLGKRKGRYISLVNYFQAVGTSKATFGIIKGLIRNVTNGKILNDSNFNNVIGTKGLKEIDAENMRKIMMEVVLLTGIYSSYFLVSILASGLDPEENPKTKWLLNILINQSLRLRTDILFYIDPRQFKALTRDLVPAASLVKDTAEWLGSVQRLIMNDDEISTGVYSGNSRFLRETAQMLPFTTQIYKNVNYSMQTFDK